MEYLTTSFLRRGFILVSATKLDPDGLCPKIMIDAAYQRSC